MVRVVLQCYEAQGWCVEYRSCKLANSRLINVGRTSSRSTGATIQENVCDIGGNLALNRNFEVEGC